MLYLNSYLTLKRVCTLVQYLLTLHLNVCEKLKSKLFVDHFCTPQFVNARHWIVASTDLLYPLQPKMEDDMAKSWLTYILFNCYISIANYLKGFNNILILVTTSWHFTCLLYGSFKVRQQLNNNNNEKPHIGIYVLQQPQGCSSGQQ